jgi:hypothetical protein
MSKHLSRLNTRYISLAVLKGMPTLEIDMEALFIQLYNTMNINTVVHKLIEWKGEEESATN